MKRTGAIALLVVPVVAVVALTGVAAYSGERSAEHALAAERYGSASAAAAEASAAALDLHAALVESDDRAEDAIAAAEAVLAVTDGTVDADDLADLRGLLASVVAGRVVPIGVPALPASLRSGSAAEYTAGLEQLKIWQHRLEDWVDGASVTGLDGAVLALRAGTYSTAGTARATGQSVLDTNAGASADSRAALSAAIAELGSVIEGRGDAAEAVTAVASAAQVVKDSQAAADAAAAASSASSSSGPSERSGPSDAISRQFAEDFCRTFRFVVQPDLMVCEVLNGDTGEVYTFYR